MFGIQGLGAPLFARGLSLIAGAVANVYFLTSAAQSLPTGDFGLLAVAMNVTILLQVTDLGVAADAINSFGKELSQGRSPWARQHAIICLIVALVLCPIAVGIIFWVGSSLEAYSVQSLVWMSVVSTSAGALASAGKVYLNWFVSTLHPGTYYGLQLLQPVFLLTALFLAHPAAIETLMLVYALALLAPCGCAWLLVTRSTSRLVRQDTTGQLRAIVARASPLGVRQLGTSLVFGALPTLVGIGGGSEAAAKYAIPHRVYLSVWNVAAVIHTMFWGKAARHASGDRATELNGVLEDVRRISWSISLPLAIAFAVLALGVEEWAGRAVDSLSVAIVGLLATSLVARCLFLADGLFVTVRPQGSQARTELLWGIVGALAVLFALRFEVSIAGGFLVFLFSVVIGLSQRNARRRKN